jgi:rhodanese-related sulfurtransferase
MATTSTESANRLPITTGFQDLVASANAAIHTLSIGEASDRLTDEDVVFVDVRDGPELENEGKIPGAVHASRGMLEFHVDPASPFHLPDFVPGKEFVLYCSMGGRSALSAQRLQEMGVDGVSHLEGGFAAWKEASGPIEGV